MQNTPRSTSIQRYRFPQANASQGIPSPSLSDSRTVVQKKMATNQQQMPGRMNNPNSVSAKRRIYSGTRVFNSSYEDANNPPNHTRITSAVELPSLGSTLAMPVRKLEPSSAATSPSCQAACTTDQPGATYPGAIHPINFPVSPGTPGTSRSGPMPRIRGATVSPKSAHHKSVGSPQWESSPRGSLRMHHLKPSAAKLSSSRMTRIDSHSEAANDTNKTNATGLVQQRSTESHDSSVSVPSASSGSSVSIFRYANMRQALRDGYGARIPEISPGGSDTKCQKFEGHKLQRRPSYEVRLLFLFSYSNDTNAYLKWIKNDFPLVK